MRIVKQIGHAESVLSRKQEPLGPLSPATLRAYLSRALVVAAFLVAYVIFEWVSFIHEYKGLPITPWNPGLGLVFALMVFGGARYGKVLFAGVVVAEIVLLQSSLKWPIILGRVDGFDRVLNERIPKSVFL